MMKSNESSKILNKFRTFSITTPISVLGFVLHEFLETHAYNDLCLSGCKLTENGIRPYSIKMFELRDVARSYIIEPLIATNSYIIKTSKICITNVIALESQHDDFIYLFVGDIKNCKTACAISNGGIYNKPFKLIDHDIKLIPTQTIRYGTIAFLTGIKVYKILKDQFELYLKECKTSDEFFKYIAVDHLIFSDGDGIMLSANKTFMDRWFTRTFYYVSTYPYICNQSLSDVSLSHQHGYITNIGDNDA